VWAHGFWWLDERAGALLSRRCRGGASRARDGRGLFGRPATRYCVNSSRSITTTQTEAVASANGGAPRSMRSTTLARRNTNARCASARRHVRTAKIQATTPAAHATSATCRKVSNRLLIVPTRTVGGDQTADGSRMDGGRLSCAEDALLDSNSLSFAERRSFRRTYVTVLAGSLIFSAASTPCSLPSCWRASAYGLTMAYQLRLNIETGYTFCV